MHKYIKELLECPVCHHELEWTTKKETKERIVNGEAKCIHCQATYPIQDEIGIFLTPDLPRNDLWSSSESYFKNYLKENPEFKDKFLNTPLEELHPTDLFIRGSLLEDSDPIKARKIIQDGTNKIYTEEYKDGRNKQIEYILNNIPNDEPIIDLASGMGTLIEKLASNVDNYIIATDFSPLVLRKNHAVFKQKNLHNKMSFLSFDARKTPFKNDAVKIMTTFVGLPNINKPMDLLYELRRIISGKLMAINHLFSPTDKTHFDFLHENGLETFLYEEKLVKAFQNANFTVANKNLISCFIKPTPEGEFFKFKLDSIPVKDTTIEWCVTCAN